MTTTTPSVREDVDVARRSRHVSAMLEGMKLNHQPAYERPGVSQPTGDIDDCSPQPLRLFSRRSDAHYDAPARPII